MIDRSRASRAVLCCALVSALAAPSALAASFSAPNGAATMTVTYRISGGGDDLPASHERHVVWKIDDTYEVRATMVAGKPSGFGALHRPDAAETARESERMRAADAASADMGDMMAKAQKIMAQCGDDEACVQRETIKMSQTIDPNSARMKSAKQNIAKASVVPGERYQMFSPKEQSGTFKIAETSRIALFDAACSLKTESRCLVETNVAGTGAQTDGNGKTSFGTGATAEYDAQSGSLAILLPMPGLSTAKETRSGAKTGSADAHRNPLKGVKLDQVTVDCGDCKSASGSLVKNVDDELTGRPAKLIVEWTFSRP